MTTTPNNRFPVINFPTSRGSRTSRLTSNWVVLLILFGWLAGHQTASGQDYNITGDDFKTFGRKVPMSLASAFSTLAGFSPYENPAYLAFVTDNSMSIDLPASDRGSGYNIAFTGPNFSLYSARQEGGPEGFNLHTKKLLGFSFGLALGDPAPPESRALALGLAIHRLSDVVEGQAFDTTGVIMGADTASALAVTIGGIFKLGRSQIEVNILDLVLSGDDKSYDMRVVVGFRTYTDFGLQVSVQGMPGTGYGESNFGLKVGLAQSFFNARLVSRLQMVSFFDDQLVATMQNITGGVGYRMKPRKVRGVMAALLDTEFSYTLSFLAVPNIIGTHMIALVKYF